MEGLGLRDVYTYGALISESGQSHLVEPHFFRLVYSRTIYSCC
jgi:hypothetical protein